MSNKDISRLLRQTADLLLLHGQNEFQARAYQGALRQIESLSEDLTQHTQPQTIEALGFTPSMAQKIHQTIQENTFPEHQHWLNQTPPGLLDILAVRGLGAKKVRTIWQTLGIQNLHELLRACEEGRIAQLKGFGEKTQANIAEEVKFRQAQRGRFLYAETEPYADFLEQQLAQCLSVARYARAGTLARQLEILEELTWVAATHDRTALRNFLDQQEDMRPDAQQSSPFVWRGFFEENRLPVAVYLVAPEQFEQQLLLHTAAEAHLAHRPEGQSETLFALARRRVFATAKDFYAALGWQEVLPPLREGTFELVAAQQHSLPTRLIQPEDIRGILHAHSTYSDGKHSLRQMATACRDAGYAYLGITDHSQTAAYAGGLKPDDIRRQHDEIDALNAELAPFRIFKGIESDILPDGQLDYPDDLLESFDFIIASVHGNLRMDRQKATQRILAAIQNPHTTILGHLTGRLLLKREGYPLDMEAILAACQSHGVAIEINAHPQRLDLDWRWIHEAIRYGIQLSINPDAHQIEGYQHVKYGVLVAQKGGLTPEQTLNTRDAEQLQALFGGA
ncbi:MAG: PHP domain-containing protein [Bernardetiaceae bacterium]